MPDLHSKIILVKNINIDRNYVNVLSYNENQMLTLCQANAVAQANDYQFIRATNSIYTNFTYAQCLQANYIAFQNPDYSNKWFFAFIDDAIYQGEENTEITFTVDSWSTWYGKWTKKPCYVIRQHATNDTIGANTIDENLDIGEVEQESFEEFISYGQDGDDYYFCINTTHNPIDNEDLNGVTKINGNLQGNYIYCFPANGLLSNITNFIYKTNQDGKINAIDCLYILPKVLVDGIGTTEKTYSATLGSFTCYLLNSNDTALSIAQNFTKTHSFTNFTPKNNKCFVYPYNYMLVSNNCGNNVIYKYENFTQANPIFNIEMSISVGASIRLVPREYKKIDYNYEESLPLAKFPTCSWSSDAFTNWLTQNAVNITTNIVSTATQIGSGTGLLTVGGSIANLIGGFYSASLQPSITGGNNNGDVNFCIRKNTFSVYHMRAKLEYLRCIDDFFSRFGYKTLRVLSPNLTGRTQWNYIEIGSSEEIGYGDVPTKYMEEINNACRRGVTIWHNHANVGNYSLSNTIVS